MTKIFRSRVYDVENLVLRGCGFLGSYILLKAAVIFLVVDYCQLLLCTVSIIITILSYYPSRICSSKRDMRCCIVLPSGLQACKCRDWICTIKRPHVTCHYGTSRFGQK